MSITGWWKVVRIGGCTDDGVSTHMLWGSGGMLPQKIRCSEIASEAILVLSPARVHGGSNTVVCHNTCQSS